MTKQTEFRIARNINLYGCCSSIIVYRGSDEIGRAVYSVSPAPCGSWLIGPSGFAGADDFNIEFTVSPALTREEVLDRVETFLRYTISAAEAASKMEAA